MYNDDTIDPAGAARRNGEKKTPSFEAHLGLFGGKKKMSHNKNFDDHPNHLTSINSEIDRRDDGNVLVAQELSDALLAKIRWGILTP